jgi:hypothetical protein
LAAGRSAALTTILYAKEITRSLRTPAVQNALAAKVLFEIDESFIPERYNSNTELSADVVANRTNTFDFRLQSSGGKQ